MNVRIVSAVSKFFILFTLAYIIYMFAMIGYDPSGGGMLAGLHLELMRPLKIRVITFKLALGISAALLLTIAPLILIVWGIFKENLKLARIGSYLLLALGLFTLSFLTIALSFYFVWVLHSKYKKFDGVSPNEDSTNDQPTK